MSSLFPIICPCGKEVSPDAAALKSRCDSCLRSRRRNEEPTEPYREEMQAFSLARHED